MPKTTKQHAESLKAPAFCEQLPIRDFLDNVMVRTDGAFVAGFRLGGSLSYFADEFGLNQAKSALDAMIRSLDPVNMRIQLRYEIAENSGGAVDRYVDARRTDDPAALALDREREQHYRELEAAGEFINRTLTAYLIWKPPVIPSQQSKRTKVTDGREGSLFSGITELFSTSHWTSVYRSEHEKKLAQFETYISGFLSAMRSADLNPERLTHTGMFNELDRQINIHNPQPRDTLVRGGLNNLDRYRSARERLSRTSILPSDEPYINMDGLLWSVISLKELPDQTRPGLIRELLTLKIPLVISVQVHVPDQNKLINKLQTRRKKMQAAMTGRHGELRVDHVAITAQQQIDELMQDIIRSSQKAVHLSMTIAVRTSHVAYDAIEFKAFEQELAKRRLAVIQAIGRMDGAAANAETVASRRLLINTIGGLADVNKREHTMLSKNAADFLPVEMPWGGTQKTPLALFETPYNQAFPFSPFDPIFANSNGIICAGSGTGKSVLTGKLLLTFLRGPMMVSILERGNSYQHAVSCMGGRTINFSLGSDAVLNPFDLEPGTKDPSAEHVAFLRLLTRHMLGDSGNMDSEILDSILADAIVATYKRVGSGARGTPTYSDLSEELEYYRHDNKQVEEMARLCAVKLAPWIKNGPYARLLDRKTTVNTSHRVFYANTEKLKDDPRLELAMSAIIANVMTLRASGIFGVKSLVILDEIWNLFDSQLAKFVEQMFRTARKRNSAVIGISQSLEDFTGTVEAPKKIGGYVLTTIGYVLLGRQNGSVAPLEHFLHLNKTTVGYVKDLPRTEKGVKSTFALICNETLIQPLHIVPTPTEYWTMTSFPREIAYRDYWINTHMDLPELERYASLARVFPNGLAALDELPEERDGSVRLGSTPQARQAALARHADVMSTAQEVA
jgi:hypothetical protein